MSKIEAGQSWRNVSGAEQHNIPRDTPEEKESECLSQKEGLRKLSQFLTGAICFSELEPLMLNTLGKGARKLNEGFLFRFYVGNLANHNGTLDTRISAGSEHELPEKILVVPKHFDARNGYNYCWLDCYFGDSNNKRNDHNPFNSFRLRPDLQKIDSRHWRNIEEQLLVDYIFGENAIVFEDLQSFEIVYRGGVYRLGTKLGLNIDVSENPLVREGDRLKIFPRQDSLKLYQWIDVVKVDENKPQDHWGQITSYRLLPEEHRLISTSWFGPARQILIDYLLGNPKVKFDDLKPMILEVTNNKGYKVIASHKGLKRYKHLYIAFPRSIVKPGDKIIMIPNKDDLYEWYDVYKIDKVTGRHEKQLVTSARILDGELTQSSWRGSETQRFRDFVEGRIGFDAIKPIPLIRGKGHNVALWSEKKSVVLSLSMKFKLKPRERIFLTPLSHGDKYCYFLLVKEEDGGSSSKLGRYRFDCNNRNFKLVELLLSEDDKYSVSPDQANEELMKFLEVRDE